jgi:hypothetical protein
MEAKVWPETGLLPEHLRMVVLRSLEDGRWQAHCRFEAGEARDYEFAPDAEAQRKVASTLAQDLGFTAWSADETARRLFEPFAMAADWAW